MMRITLTWHEDDQRIMEVMTLSRLMAIGRSPVCDVVVKHRTVSRQHAFLYAFGRKVYVQNISHLNAVQIGSTVLRKNETAEVQAGQTLLLGELMLQIEELYQSDSLTESMTCGSCQQVVSGQTNDCYWCGSSLAFAYPTPSV